MTGHQRKACHFEHFPKILNVYPNFDPTQEAMDTFFESEKVNSTGLTPN